MGLQYVDNFVFPELVPIGVMKVMLSQSEYLTQIVENLDIHYINGQKVASRSKSAIW